MSSGNGQPSQLANLVKYEKGMVGNPKGRPKKNPAITQYISEKTGEGRKIIDELWVIARELGSFTDAELMELVDLRHRLRQDEQAIEGEVTDIIEVI